VKSSYYHTNLTGWCQTVPHLISKLLQGWSHCPDPPGQIAGLWLATWRSLYFCIGWGHTHAGHHSTVFVHLKIKKTLGQKMSPAKCAPSRWHAGHEQQIQQSLYSPQARIIHSFLTKTSFIAGRAKDPHRTPLHSDQSAHVCRTRILWRVMCPLQMTNY
jgi:hypothetical protein